MQLKHIRKKATPLAAAAPTAATGSRHQKLFLQQLEHAQQQQQRHKSAASVPAQRLPQSHAQIASELQPAKKAKHKSVKPGAMRARQVKGKRQQVGPHPTTSIRDKHQLQQHRKLISMEALRKREESRSAWVQAYREAKHRGGAKQNAAGATPSSLAHMVAAGS